MVNLDVPTDPEFFVEEQIKKVVILSLWYLKGQGLFEIPYCGAISPA
jgi:hypothetical protein